MTQSAILTGYALIIDLGNGNQVIPVSQLYGRLKINNDLNFKVVEIRKAKDDQVVFSLSSLTGAPDNGNELNSQTDPDAAWAEVTANLQLVVTSGGGGGGGPATSVTVTSSALPSGAATAANQALQNTALSNILTALGNDATEATLLAVQNAVESIEANSSLESTQVQVRNLLDSIDTNIALEATQLLVKTAVESIASTGNLETTQQLIRAAVQAINSTGNKEATQQLVKAALDSIITLLTPGGQHSDLDTVVTTSGSVAAGRYSISMTTSTDFVGSINGVPYTGQNVVAWTADVKRTLAAKSYTITAGSIKIHAMN